MMSNEAFGNVASQRKVSRPKDPSIHHQFNYLEIQCLSRLRIARTKFGFCSQFKARGLFVFGIGSHAIQCKWFCSTENLCQHEVSFFPLIKVIPQFFIKGISSSLRELYFHTLLKYDIKVQYLYDNLASSLMLVA